MLLNRHKPGDFMGNSAFQEAHFSKDITHEFCCDRCLHMKIDWLFDHILMNDLFKLKIFTNVHCVICWEQNDVTTVMEWKLKLSTRSGLDSKSHRKSNWVRVVVFWSIGQIHAVSLVSCRGRSFLIKLNPHATDQRLHLVQSKVKIQYSIWTNEMTILYFFQFS